MGQCRGRVWLTVLELVGGLALFEGVQAEVAAALGPFVGLRCQDGADQADWSAWCFSDWGSFSSRESIGWRPCQQRDTQTSSRPKWCVR